MTSTEIVEGLKTCEVFASLNEEEIRLLTTSLATACQIETYNAGDAIYAQGEHLARFYVIVEVLQ